VDFDPFAEQGEIVARLPWGPCIRKLNSLQVCYYFEPSPAWELENRLCRSANLLSDGTIYASLEDQRSQLFRLNY
jgi:cyclic pyranopterin phosphate synthase